MTAWVCGLPSRAERDSYDDDQVEAIVVAAQAGDREAFAQLYGLFYQRMFFYLRSRVNNETDAEDLAQDVFLEAMSTIGTYQRGETTRFEAWLFGKGKGMLLTVHRKRMWRLQQEV